MLDDLIANGRANATHDCLRHNPAGVNGKTDKESIHQECPHHNCPGPCPIQAQILDQGNGPPQVDQHVPPQVQPGCFP